VTGILVCNSADFAEIKKQEVLEFYHWALLCCAAYASSESLGHTCRFSSVSVESSTPLALESVIYDVWCGSTSSYSLSLVLDTYQEPGDCLTIRKNLKGIVRSQKQI